LNIQIKKEKKKEKKKKKERTSYERRPAV